MNFDDAKSHLPKEVQAIVDQIAKDAGTYDADFSVFEAAAWEIHRYRLALKHYATNDHIGMIARNALSDSE